MNESPPAGSELSSADVGALVTRGDAQAAIRLGEIFEPGFLEHARLSGARGDRNSALFWYRCAREMRAPEAEVLVQCLKAEKDL